MAFPWVLGIRRIVGLRRNSSLFKIDHPHRFSTSPQASLPSGTVCSPPGGVLIVYDPMHDDERTELLPLLAALTMLLETRDGGEYSANECCSWMQEAGVRRNGDTFVGIR